ncbi:2'-5' RNA ligase family protein [Arthrobacter sp. NicSoilB8]|uniref:2'-5' RNA ligase family protein n=1 Tax=Arthrobacter sp. NicSoilB8 TaxID=2830998 RepID=UPI001CC6B35E|nr:2'-5' RNA ligase family protein [Arthrobacter sp. NicSoilB8]BCW69195.1 hypothetical protein NicSoilB8_02390 [Arthrobacter sp. NicSoilB8]
MRNLIAVAFVEPVTEGLEFPRDDWPLHITLVKFDVAEPRQEAGEPAGVPAETTSDAAAAEPAPEPADGSSAAPGPGDPLAGKIAALMAEPVAAALGSQVIVGGEAGFGRAGSIPVNLIEPSEQLQSLHNALVRIVQELPGRIPTLAYTLEGFRPHVSHHGDKRLHPGDAVALDRIALVDMAPDGGHATRRILKLWTQRPA